MEQSSSTLLERLQAHCRAKPGSSVGRGTYGGNHISYAILGTQPYYYATFYVDETPIRLQLPCSLDYLENAPQEPRHQISKDWQWGGTDWKWVDVFLEEDLPDKTYIHLIDESYAICLGELPPTEVRLVDIVDQDLPVQNALRELIDVHELTNRSQEIHSLLKPAIWLVTNPAEETTIALGQSKIGGLPHLPAHWSYPHFEDKPLGFLAQINLAEIPNELQLAPLPSTGILYFFSLYGLLQDDGYLGPDLPWERGEEPGFTQVLYFDGPTTALIRHPKLEGAKPFGVAAVRFWKALSLPRAWDRCRDPILKTLNWSEDEFERLDELCFAFGTVQSRKLPKVPFSRIHQLLGYADPVQDAVTTADIGLLCQFDSDEGIDMNWGDGGLIYFTLPRSDLENKNFANIYAEFQST